MAVGPGKRRSTAKVTPVAPADDAPVEAPTPVPVPVSGTRKRRTRDDDRGAARRDRHGGRPADRSWRREHRLPSGRRRHRAAPARPRLPLAVDRPGITGIGNQITRLALPFQVYVLTGSTLAVAALTLVQLVPILIFALGAGSLADAVDRRRLLLVTQIGLIACSLGPRPARRSSGHPPLVGPVRRRVRRGRPVGGRPAGPLVGDPAARPAGAPAVGDRPEPAQLPGRLDRGAGDRRDADRDRRPARRLPRRRAVVHRLDRRHRSRSRRCRRSGPSPGPGSRRSARASASCAPGGSSSSTFVIDLNAMIFGMPTSLFPALALDVFKVGPGGLGLMAAAPAAGAFLGALLLGLGAGRRRVGRGGRHGGRSSGARRSPLFGLSTFSVPRSRSLVPGRRRRRGRPLRGVPLDDRPARDARRAARPGDSIHILVVTSGPRLGDIEAATVGRRRSGPQLRSCRAGCCAWPASRSWRRLASRARPARRPRQLNPRGAATSEALDRRPREDETDRIGTARALPPAIGSCIVGGGFAGLYAAQEPRRRPEVALTLVDRRNLHLFQPLLYQVATGALSPGEIAQPLRSILRKQRNTTVLLGEAVGIDPERARGPARPTAARSPYDTLDRRDRAPITRTSATTSGRAVAPGPEDASTTRPRSGAGSSSRSRPPSARPTPSGAGVDDVRGRRRRADRRRAGRARSARSPTTRCAATSASIDPRDARIILVEAMDRVLPTYPPDRSASAQAPARAARRRGPDRHAGRPTSTTSG